MQKHQITGLGPVQADGSREIFTVLPRPFTVTKEWLDLAPAHPAVGDDIVEQEDGTLALVLTEAGETNAAVEEIAAAKKEDGSQASVTGSEPAKEVVKGLKHYVANPIMVVAGKIVEVGQKAPDGSVEVMLEDSSIRTASAEMVSRIMPIVGDYWVIQTQGADGTYEYLNPKDVFERKYSPVTQ